MENTTHHPLYLTLHGHFYQPPRENPWTGRVEAQESASPDHDWNARIAKQCYTPNGASRLLSPFAHITGIVNNYEYMSFNFGPTLIGWIREELPGTYSRIREGDARSLERLGHGNAIAQVYNHMIMPLASPKDRVTQIRWGKADFEFHFGRAPEGMWLAETAINMDTVVDLIHEGIQFTILSPTQAQAFRALGTEEWTDCADTSIDTTRPYRVFPRGKNGEKLCEGHLDVFFYNAGLSSAVGFEHLLRDANAFGGRIKGAWNAESEEPQLVSIGTDGESYGHHEPFGDMCAAYLFDQFCPQNNMVPVNYGWYLEHFPPAHEVELKNAHGEGCAWSCAHGVGRWYRNCGCHTGGPDSWNQEWRGPLRKAFDHVKEVADRVFEREFAMLSDMDPWEARNHYADVLVDPPDPGRREDFAKAVLRNKSQESDRAILLSLLEIQKFCLYSYTSCGWFFNDIEGLEPVQNMRYALRAMEMLQAFLPRGNSLESECLAILSKAESNEHKMNGAEIFIRWAKPGIPTVYSLMAAKTAELHLDLEGHRKILARSEIRNVAGTLEGSMAHQSLVKLRFTTPETLETVEATALAATDGLGRTTIVVMPASETRHTLAFADEEQLDSVDFEKLYPTAFVMRLHKLPPDYLQELNRLTSFKLAKDISAEFDHFAQNHQLSIDILADQSVALSPSIRQGIVMGMIADIQKIALAALYQDPNPLLGKLCQLVKELSALKVPVKMGSMGQLFYHRISSLMRKALETHDPDVVAQVTGLITMADKLSIDIDKPSLENQSYDAYLAYKMRDRSASDTANWSALAPMLEWLNFEP
jgi:hypothetical protein